MSLSSLKCVRIYHAHRLWTQHFERLNLKRFHPKIYFPTQDIYPLHIHAVILFIVCLLCPFPLFPLYRMPYHIYLSKKQNKKKPKFPSGLIKYPSIYLSIYHICIPYKILLILLTTTQFCIQMSVDLCLLHIIVSLNAEGGCFKMAFVSKNGQRCARNVPLLPITSKFTSLC